MTQPIPPADVQWWDAPASTRPIGYRDDRQHGPECAEQDQAPTTDVLRARLDDVLTAVYPLAGGRVAAAIANLQQALATADWTRQRQGAATATIAVPTPPSATLPDTQPPARGNGCPDVHSGVQGRTTPRHPVAIDAPMPPDDDPVIVLDLPARPFPPSDIGAMITTVALLGSGERHVQPALACLDGPALHQLGTAARVIAAAIEAEVLRRTEAQT
jgi:hypothetical protein